MKLRRALVTKVLGHNSEKLVDVRHHRPPVQHHRYPGSHQTRMQGICSVREVCHKSAEHAEAKPLFSGGTNANKATINKLNVGIDFSTYHLEPESILDLLVV